MISFIAELCLSFLFCIWRNLRPGVRNEYARYTMSSACFRAAGGLIQRSDLPMADSVMMGCHIIDIPTRANQDTGRELMLPQVVIVIIRSCHWDLSTGQNRRI
jgi:hypothetical protein